MADRLGLFGIVVGIALLLSGFGFGILAVGGALRNPQTALSLLRRTRTKAPAVPVA
jgi:F0F1-type ATP synthase membrane subunit c/vacuolar-type H+-ATPase subunit K